MKGAFSADRFWSKVQKTDTCWLWSANISVGYGRFSIGGRSVLAHRVSYELLVGPIPKGMTLDHLCRTRHCVNPNHLEPVTMKENTLRSPIARTAINKRKTHCLRGHPLSGDNLYVRPDGSRECRICKREQLRAFRKSRA